MIRSLENLIGYRTVAINGDIGTVEDFYFDDRSWKLRYVVASAGGWLNRRHVLLSMDVAGEITDSKRLFKINLTKESICASPGIESDIPVTRQKEILLAEHFGWRPYWTPDPLFGVDRPNERMEMDGVLPGADPHLRSLREVTTYTVCGSGLDTFVLDMIADDVSGEVNWLAVASSRSLAAQAYLIPAGQVDRIDWTGRLVVLKEGASASMTPFDPAEGVNARTVTRYYDYLGHRDQSISGGEERR